MTELMQASNQWATRPDDERYTNLLDMRDHFNSVREMSRELVVSTRQVQAVPLDNHRGLEIRGPNGGGYVPTHWAFGQLAALAEAPGGYLRTLPAPMAADCLNFGLAFKRDIGEFGVLLQKGDSPMLRAATGPRYGRVWNGDILNGLVDRFGDGVNGQWRVPGEFGKRVEISKANTTLFASDRDFFVFLADEDHRIELKNRRNGKPGSLARGFFVWNSEVGAQTLGIATFLFDYACSNRIVWGAEEYNEIRIRHTVSAPDRWLEEVTPALQTYAKSSTRGIVQAIEDARKDRMGDKLNEFLTQRFSKSIAWNMQNVHKLEEGRPIENRWDVVVAATAVARGIPHQDARVDLERKAGELLHA
jgi:hypothetical protein